MQSGDPSDGPSGGTPNKPFSCPRCDSEFATKKGKTRHDLESKCGKRHQRSQQPKSPKDTDFIWNCPRCSYTAERKSAVTRHIEESCWKSCDECVDNGRELACSHTWIGNKLQPCRPCQRQAYQCHSHSRPITGISPVKGDSKTKPPPFNEHKGSKEAGCSEEKNDRNKSTSEPQSQDPPTQDLHSFGELPLSGPPSEAFIPGLAPSPLAPLTNRPGLATSIPGSRPSQNPWSNQTGRVPGHNVPIPPYNSRDPFVRAPHDTTGPQTGQYLSGSFGPQRGLSRNSMIFHPPTIRPGDSVIKIHIQNTENPSSSETFRLNISESFGPYLEAYCFAHGQRFGQDWLFVWVYSDPQYGNAGHYRRLIVRWHYTPIGLVRSGLPMQDGEVFQIIRSDDPRIQGSLQQSDQRDLAAEQAAREQSARDTSRAMPSGSES